jgi:diguanylate cyclase (GGDEF)-like protein
MHPRTLATLLVLVLVGAPALGAQAPADTLLVCADPAFPPFDFVDDDGVHRGIAAEVLAGVTASLGVATRLVPSDDWTGTLRLARGGGCDLVAMLNRTAEREEYLAFTRPYLTFENAIVTHRPAYHRGLESLVGRTVALPAGYRIAELIANEHPGIAVLTVPDTDEALRAVSRGDAYATLVNQQRLIRDVPRLRLRNVHYAGDALVQDRYRIGVRRDDPELLARIDSALARFPPREISLIMERWYTVPIEATVDWRLMLTLGGASLGVLAFLLLHVYHRQRYYRLLEAQNRELGRISETDPLTGTANRRRLDARLLQEIERARRHGRPLAVVLFDLDGFKRVNDRDGHPAGDAVLVDVARRAGAGKRQTDELGRWGGDEFLIVCPETDLDAARVVAERVRAAIASRPAAGGRAVTVSLGVAELEEGDTAASLLRRADRALYDAKAAGGDCVAAPQTAALMEP